MNNGGDTDSFYNNFLLSTKDSEILGLLDPNLYTITYHKSLIGAQTDQFTDVIDKTIPYRNETAESQTIYVRVENNANAVCNDASVSFNLTVLKLPIINAVVELKQCDNDTDAFADFNLEEARTDISADYLNETFVYYGSLADAQKNTSPIINPLVFQNRKVTKDTVWATVTNTNGCERIAQINLTVSTTGIPASFLRTFNTCDDLLDSNGNNNVNNNDTDGISSFDFSSVDSEIRNLFTAVGQQIDVTYYRNEADAAAEINAINDITNYRNIGYPNTQTIYVRVDNTLDNDCLGFGPHISLNIDPVPDINPTNNLEFCDDFDSGNFDDGINININLNTQISTILGSPSPMNYDVSFHRNEADANSGSAPIANPSNFTNTIRDLQTIYVRVVNKTTGCFNAKVKFDIIIHPLPTIANPIPDLEVCDVHNSIDSDPRNRLAQNISLGDRDADVLDGRDPNIFLVSYHKTLQDAIDNISPLSKTNYANDPLTTNLPANMSGDDPAIEIIYISMVNKITGCRSETSTLKIVIHPEPNISLNISNYIDCDNTSDSNNDDTNGINGNISLINKIPEILIN